jgi:MFS family permease
MILARASLMAAGVIVIIFTQPFLASFGVDVADFGLLTTPLRIVAIVGALLAYRLATRLGERWLLYLLAAGTAGALVVLGLVDALVAFTMFGVISIAMAIAGVVSADYISRHAPQAMRATVLSLAQMVFSTILFVTEPALGFIADRTSLQVMFLVCAAAFGALSAVALIAWTAAEREERRAAPEPELAGAGAEP